MDRRKFIKDTAPATASIAVLNFSSYAKNASGNKVERFVPGWRR